MSQYCTSYPVKYYTKILKYYLYLPWESSCTDIWKLSHLNIVYIPTGIASHNMLRKNEKITIQMQEMYASALHEDTILVFICGKVKHLQKCHAKFKHKVVPVLRISCTSLYTLPHSTVPRLQCTYIQVYNTQATQDHQCSKENSLRIQCCTQSSRTHYKHNLNLPADSPEIKGQKI